MPYRIRARHAIADEITRIVEEQIDRAVAEIDDSSIGHDETVHQVRKRCKKVRAVLRLLRGPLDEDGCYDAENAWYRDAASGLARMRDAAALVETHDALMGHFGAALDPRAFRRIRHQLVLRRARIARVDVERDDPVAVARQRLVAGRRRVATWAVQARDFDALGAGLARTYRRARTAMAGAYDDPSAVAFHEWRKRVKYHWYHCRLLQCLWPPVFAARGSELSRLADILGDEHDLGAFREMLVRGSEPFDRGEETVQALLGLVDRRREVLRQDARALGGLAFAEKTRHLVRRFRAYSAITST